MTSSPPARENGHTPGSWACETGDHTHRYTHVLDSDGRTIFYKYGAGTAKEADQDEVNGQLVAAAPDMLEALKALDAVLGDTPMPDCASMNRLIAASGKARAAIAKATSPIHTAPGVGG